MQSKFAVYSIEILLKRRISRGMNSIILKLLVFGGGKSLSDASLSCPPLNDLRSSGIRCVIVFLCEHLTSLKMEKQETRALRASAVGLAATLRRIVKGATIFY